MKAIVIAHRDEALNTFTTFIKKLQTDLLDYYYSGTWINADRGSSPMQAFVLGMVDRILLHFAGGYFSPDNFSLSSASFVLVTGRPKGAELVQLPYPVDEDLLGEHPIIRQNFCGRFTGIFDRLLFLYAVPAPEQIYARTTTSIENVINLVLLGIFSRIERGSLSDQDLAKMPDHPPARICVAMRVQDVNVDARLMVGADLVWIPVVPEKKFMTEIMDTILGFKAPEEKPTPPWESVIENLTHLDLTDQQEQAARRLNQGTIHSVYRENGRIFLVMTEDLNRVYEWVGNTAGSDRPGYWVHARERMEYLKLVGSGF